MKTLLTQFASYNLWANGLLVACIRALPPALHTQPVSSSFPHLSALMLHLWDAESIWWQRVKLQETVLVPSATQPANMEIISNGLLEQSRQWANWVQRAQPHMLEHEFIYRNSKKEAFKQPVAQVLLQVFNHSTYHRGQVVSMLRQLEVTSIPQTDFIVWSRSQS